MIGAGAVMGLLGVSSVGLAVRWRRKAFDECTLCSFLETGFTLLGPSGALLIVMPVYILLLDIAQLCR